LEYHRKSIGRQKDTAKTQRRDFRHVNLASGLSNAESKRIDHFSRQKYARRRSGIDDSNAGKRNDGGNEKGRSATETIGDGAGTDGANHGGDLSECVPQALPIRRNKILAIANVITKLLSAN
jgi:hypothetical protein